MGSERLDRIAAGRTDLVIDHLADGRAARSQDAKGVSLIESCAYYGDVTAVRLLLERGESLQSLGDDLGLNGAAFHGHWRLAEFLIEAGADPNHAASDTGETPLHSAICTPARAAHDLVVRVLLAHGADPNRATRPGVETGAFMRDCRTKGETPLHRAAAFGSEETIDMLVEAGAALGANGRWRRDAARLGELARQARLDPEAPLLWSVHDSPGQKADGRLAARLASEQGSPRRQAQLLTKQRSSSRATTTVSSPPPERSASRSRCADPRSTIAA